MSTWKHLKLIGLESHFPVKGPIKDWNILPQWMKEITSIALFKKYLNHTYPLNILTDLTHTFVTNSTLNLCIVCALAANLS